MVTSGTYSSNVEIKGIPYQIQFEIGAENTISGFILYQMSAFSGKPVGSPIKNEDITPEFINELRLELEKNPPNNSPFLEVKGATLPPELITSALEYMNTQIAPRQAQTGENKEKAKM